ncbi:hypothetical protein I7I49_20140 [Sinorhizobium meliloti]|uniref:hypothetical protein n=1 Tax=Rhizobium meliloti TaxID=382 RepID=UPI00237F66A1|nr:hypothetical protein [Sinorhizobium meliloti]MDE3812557.1 hypothetical protein [Sinorhizobium meliloti]
MSRAIGFGGAHQIQQARRQHGLAILVANASFDMDQHALALDVEVSNRCDFNAKLENCFRQMA